MNYFQSCLFAGLSACLASFGALGCGSSSSGPSDNPSSGDGDGDGDGDAPSGTGGAVEEPSCTNCSNGCCNGDTCVPFSGQNDATCGTDGTSCAPCEFGRTCDSAGECAIDYDVCSPLTCSGCCADSETCVGPGAVKWDGCGIDGDSCQTCQYGAACQDDGSCSDQIDDRAVFFVTVDSIQLNETNLGQGWDVGSPPDPFVCVSDGVVEYCTTACSDTLSCVPLDGHTSLQITGEAFKAEGLSFTVYDEDPLADDVAGTAVHADSTLLGSGDSYVLAGFGAVTELRFSLRQTE